MGAENIIDALEMNFKLHRETRNVIESLDKRFTYGKGDEGAWAPNVNNDQALEIIEKAVRNCGYTLGKDMAIGIDFASSSFWNEEAAIRLCTSRHQTGYRRTDRVCKQAYSGL